MVASDVFGAATDRARAHAQPGLPRRARTATDFYSDMVPSSAPLHIYHRDIEADQHTSLTVVTGHIQSGDRVLTWVAAPARSAATWHNAMTAPSSTA